MIYLVRTIEKMHSYYAVGGGDFHCSGRTIRTYPVKLESLTKEVH